MHKHIFKFLLFAVFCLLLVSSVYAKEYTSDNYKILDPTLNEKSAILSSDSYKLIGTIGDLAAGYSSSTTYTVDARSSAYPSATAPVLSATAGVSQVSLSWTASQGSLGWTVSGYDVCTGTTTNVYTCEDAGNVLVFTKTSLTAGTPYFFRVRAKDAFGSVVVRSNEATATPTAGGGGGTTPPPSNPPPLVVHDVIMSGFAYPGARVSLFQDGLISATTTAIASGSFSGTIPAVSTGTHTFGVTAADSQGRASVLITYTVNVSQITTTIGNIIIPPTIALSADTVTKGETLIVSGMSPPASAIVASDSSNNNYNTTASSAGVWSLNLNTSGLTPGNYTIKAKAIVGSSESDFGSLKSFVIASSPEVVVPPPVCHGSDMNIDGKVNNADISILISFWNSTVFTNKCLDLNSDGKVNLVDFSIMLFNWTG